MKKWNNLSAIQITGSLEMKATVISNNNSVAMLSKKWHLGPKVASVVATDNKPFWSSIAKAWGVTAAEARRRLCANCEYYNNSTDMTKQMEKIPLNELDMDGGGRGYCHKFEFICHNLRTCQAWEEKEFKLPEID